MPTLVTEDVRANRDANLWRRVFEFCDEMHNRGDRLTSDAVRRAVGGNANKIHDFYREWRDQRRTALLAERTAPVDDGATAPVANSIETVFGQLTSQVASLISETLRSVEGTISEERTRLAVSCNALIRDAQDDTERARQEAEDEGANADAKSVALHNAEERIEELQRELSETRQVADRRVDETRRETEERLNGALRDPDERISALREQMTATERRVMEVEAERKAAEATVVALRDQMADSRAGRERAEREAAAAREHVESVRADLEGKLDRATATIAELKAAVARTEAERDAAKQQLERSGEEYARRRPNVEGKKRHQS